MVYACKGEHLTTSFCLLTYVSLSTEISKYTLFVLLNVNFLWHLSYISVWWYMDFYNMWACWLCDLSLSFGDHQSYVTNFCPKRKDWHLIDKIAIRLVILQRKKGKGQLKSSPVHQGCGRRRKWKFWQRLLWELRSWIAACSSIIIFSDCSHWVLDIQETGKCGQS